MVFLHRKNGKISKSLFKNLAVLKPSFPKISGKFGFFMLVDPARACLKTGSSRFSNDYVNMIMVYRRWLCECGNNDSLSNNMCQLATKVYAALGRPQHEYCIWHGKSVEIGSTPRQH